MDAESLQKGQVLKGKYRIDERLGAGGMAVVYRARNVAVDRTVAIKVLNPQLATNQLAVKRFKREARAANQARHPNIVDVLDVDQDGDLLFIVQEYLQGEDMAARIKRDNKLPPADALAIMMPVIEGVGAAHHKGVVHRDLKPDNVFLVQDNGQIVPKILDFGISKMPLTDLRATGPGGGPVQLKGGRITVAGVAMGTPYYMSPEQIRDPGSVDIRTDVWALGVMLYEVLSGIMPFDADDMGQLFAKIHTQEPRRLDRFVPEVSAAVAKVVHRCLQVEPTARYDSANDLARALERARHDIDDEPSVAEDDAAQSKREAAFAVTKVPSNKPPPGGLELDLDFKGAGRAKPRASEPSPSEPSPSNAEESKPKSSGAGFSLELDLPKPSRPPQSVPSDTGAASSRGGDSVSSQPQSPSMSGGGDIFGFDDDDDDDDAFPGMDLAVEVPSASGGRSGTRKPRIARTATEAGPESRRRIHMRQRAGRRQAASYIRMALGALVVVSLALGSSYLTPAGITAARTALGANMVAAYGGAAILGVVALVVTLSYGLRLVSYGLFLASAGLALLVVALGGALVLDTAPGLVGDNIVTIALLIGPYAVLATVVGYILFAVSHGRELRQHEEDRLVGNLLLLMAVLGLAAGAWIVRKPGASLLAIQKIRSPHAEPAHEEARRFAVDVRGGRLPPAASSVSLRTNRRGGAAVGHVSVTLREPEKK